MNEAEILTKLEQPITTLVNPRAHSTKAALNRLGIFTLQDVVEFLPFRYEDQSNLVRINELKAEIDSVIIGRIVSVSSRRSKRGVLIIQAVIDDGEKTIPAIWFNQRYLLKFLREDDQITLFGCKKLIPTMKNPFMVKKIIDQPGVCPIYHRTSGISQLTIRKIINDALCELPLLPNLLPEKIQRTFSLANRDSSLRNVHQPKSMNDLHQARRLLAAEELFIMALRSERARLLRTEKHRPPIEFPVEFIKDFVKNLPMKLTESQKKSIWEITGDLQKEYPMNRLLYGEVGSGKTAVAAVVAAAVAKCNRRVAFLCPTLSLAEQQYRVLQQFFSDTHITIGSVNSLEKKNTDAQILVGTHALLNQSSKFDLIIIDEQHRFGVAQRQALLQHNPLGDVLMMSATPIPRSFAQTLLRHLDVTYLTQKPQHQKEIITRVFSPKERSSVETTISNLLSRGEQGYVVCPRITESNEEVLDLLSEEKKSVQSEMKRLKTVFPTAQIAAIHGKADSTSNKTVLEKFRHQQVDILVATTIIEVGIDNPNATWILIEDADYFGLSTLHQLRGRVGRGEQQSYCFMASTNRTEIAQKRLDAFSQITSGIELAEIDLELRGPGELLGNDQSGAVPLRYASWGDTELLQKMFAEVRNFRQDDLVMNPLLQKALTENNDQLATA